MQFSIQSNSKFEELDSELICKLLQLHRAYNLEETFRFVTMKNFSLYHLHFEKKNANEEFPIQCYHVRLKNFGNTANRDKSNLEN